MFANVGDHVPRVLVNPADEGGEEIPIRFVASQRLLCAADISQGRRAETPMLRASKALVRGAGNLRSLVEGLRGEGDLGEGDKSTPEDMELRAGAVIISLGLLCVLFN